MQRHHAWLLAIGFIFSAASAHAENVIILKAGTYSLSDTRQPLTSDSPDSQLTIEKEGGLYGLEYEWRFKNGFSIGGEYTESRHNYVENFVCCFMAAKGDFRPFTLTFNGKRYFKVNEWFLPYLGFGIGLGGVLLDESGDNDRSYVGLATQAMAGADFKLSRMFGIYAGAKWVSSKCDDSWGDTIDISGTSYMGGISIHF